MENRITAFVLAGGKSSRMGRDKGLLEFNGKHLIDHVIEKLLPVVDSVIIISNQSGYHDLGLPVIEDEIKNIGPAGGIYTALKYSKTNLNFIAACDMPFITTEAIKYIIDQTEDFEICIPLNQGRIEPLFGVYSKECLPIWEQSVLKGEYKLQNLMKPFRLKEVNIDNNSLFNQKIFTNLNSENDLRIMK
jgi:molybdopterin-guanine dinucleotide biosynthesis protein A